jgi:hypothetical protein
MVKDVCGVVTRVPSKWQIYSKVPNVPLTLSRKWGIFEKF